MPEVANYPEAIDIIAKYVMINKFGAAYTFQSLDEMDYLEFLYIQFCMIKENETIEQEHKKMQLKVKK